MVYRLERTQQLNCSIDTAWRFFSSPHNLEKISPKEMKFRILSEIDNTDIFEGMIIDYKVSPLFNISLRWQTKITQVDLMKSFTDFQQKGPYKLWNHFHEFIENKQGVLMKDTVDYQLPLGPLGTMMHSLVVKRKLEHIFDFRFRVLEDYFLKNTEI